MLLSFSGISAVTMLVLVANLCVQFQGAKSQMKPMSLIDNIKGEILFRSSLTKRKPLYQNPYKLFSDGSAERQNPHSAWSPDNMQKVMSDYTFQSGESHAPVRHRAKNQRKHKAMSEKMQIRKSVKRSKRRTERSYRQSTFQNSGRWKNKKESALQNILLIHHRNRAHANGVKHRRIYFVNRGKSNLKRNFHNFDTLREPMGNEYIPNFVPPNPENGDNSYSPNIDPDEVSDQGMTNENYFAKPLNQINFLPNTYNGIENSALNPSQDNGMKQQTGPSFHDYYEQPEAPVYRSFQSLDYDSIPESHFAQENGNYPLRYQKALTEDSLEQQSNPLVGVNEDVNMNGHNVYLGAPEISQRLLGEDKGEAMYIKNTNAPKHGIQYGENKPHYPNINLFSKQYDTLDADSGKYKIGSILQGYQFRPETVDHSTQELISDERENVNKSTAPHREAVPSEYELLKGANKTGALGSTSEKCDSNRAKEILKKILKDIQTADDDFQSAKREEFVCEVNGSWVSKVGGVRLQLMQFDDRNLKVKVEHTVPPRYNGLLCKDWKFTGTVPPNAQDSGLFTLSGYSSSQKKVAAFLGQCHSCGGEDMITGTWLMGKKARNCKDTHLTINEVRDVWRKEMLNSLVKNRVTDVKHIENSKTATASTPSVGTRTRIGQCRVKNKE